MENNRNDGSGIIKENSVVLYEDHNAVTTNINVFNPTISSKRKDDIVNNKDMNVSFSMSDQYKSLQNEVGMTEMICISENSISKSNDLGSRTNIIPLNNSVINVNSISSDNNNISQPIEIKSHQNFALQSDKFGQSSKLLNLQDKESCQLNNELVIHNISIVQESNNFSSNNLNEAVSHNRSLQSKEVESKSILNSDTLVSFNELISETQDKEERPSSSLDLSQSNSQEQVEALYSDSSNNKELYEKSDNKSINDIRQKNEISIMIKEESTIYYEYENVEQEIALTLNEDKSKIEENKEKNQLEIEENNINSPSQPIVVLEDADPKGDEVHEPKPNKRTRKKKLQTGEIFAASSIIYNSSECESEEDDDWSPKPKALGTKCNKNIRKARCLKCSGCLVEECGQCKHCLDKPKFGGSSKTRKPCIMKVCEQSSSKRKNTSENRNSHIKQELDNWEDTLIKDERDTKKQFENNKDFLEDYSSSEYENPSDIEEYTPKKQFSSKKKNTHKYRTPKKKWKLDGNVSNEKNLCRSVFIIIRCLCLT